MSRRGGNCGGEKRCGMEGGKDWDRGGAEDLPITNTAQNCAAGGGFFWGEII